MEIIVSVRNLHNHISFLAKSNPRKTALLSCDEEGTILEEISYGELLQRIEDAVAYLHDMGLTKGDRVALTFRNSAELLIISWAAWSAGIVTVPLDIKRDTPELCRYKIKLSNAKLLIVQEGAPNAFSALDIQGVEIKKFSEFRSAPDTAISLIPQHPASAARQAQESELSHEALILFTSGTTAHPKGAKLTLENLIVNAESIREWLCITAEDRFLVNLPLHHINSTTFCLSTLLSGGSIAIPPGYSNSRFWKQTAKSRATFTSIVQSILFDQLSREDEFVAVKENLKLNRIQIGSAPVVAETAKEFMKKFHIPLYQGYGQTETALRVTGVPMDLPQELYEQLVAENSIGTPMPWADLRIADENGNFLGENQEGELVVRGPAVMEGYIGNEPAFRNGYFLTGDIGFCRLIEGKRYFFLKGRKKEMIVKGGINISPVAVENQLKKICSDIDQTYVVGMSDKRYGEEVAAVICWKKNANKESAKRRLKYALVSGTPFLSAYETPAYIASLKAEEFPITSTGKVQRTVLRTSVSAEQFESIYVLFRTSAYRFEFLAPHSPYVAESLALHNHCWQPLVMDGAEYKKNIRKQRILLAVDYQNKLAGQIAFIQTNLGNQELLRMPYDALLSSDVSNSGVTGFVCVSICSAGFQPKAVPPAAQIPDAETVRAYLRRENDPVLRFHQKPKAGIFVGAELIDVIPGGRPEDVSSLGYAMLLKYPSPSNAVEITDDAPVSNQLIEAVLLLAKDVGVNNVYAYSRPGGLASYIANH